MGFVRGLSGGRHKGYQGGRGFKYFEFFKPPKKIYDIFEKTAQNLPIFDYPFLLWAIKALKRCIFAIICDYLRFVKKSVRNFGPISNCPKTPQYLPDGASEQ